MQIKWSGTVIDTENVVIPVAMLQQHNGFQVSASGAGDLLIETQEEGNAAYITQTTISAESVIVDLYGVDNVRLTASGADVPYVLRLRDEMTSNPQANWNNFPDSNS